MTTTSEYVQEAAAKIGALGAAFYFVPETLAVGAEHGLDGFRFYVLGRGGALGDVGPAVVGSAFGYFEPSFLDQMWVTARERADLSAADCGRLYHECAADYGRRHFADVPGLAEFCAAAEQVLAAADPAGLALFSGYVDQPLAADLPGRAMQLVTVLREYGGSAHLVAVLAVGLLPKVAHGVRRPDFWEPFGYRGEPVPSPTAEVTALLADADALTQRLIAPAYEVLPEPDRAALLTGLAALAAARPA